MANKRHSPVLEKRKGHHSQHGVHGTKSISLAKESIATSGNHAESKSISKNVRSVGNVNSDGILLQEEATSDVRSSLGLGDVNTVGAASKKKLHLMSKYLTAIMNFKSIDRNFLGAAAAIHGENSSQSNGKYSKQDLHVPIPTSSSHRHVIVPNGTAHNKRVNGFSSERNKVHSDRGRDTANKLELEAELFGGSNALVSSASNQFPTTAPRSSANPTSSAPSSDSAY